VALIPGRLIFGILFVRSITTGLIKDECSVNRYVPRLGGLSPFSINFLAWEDGFCKGQKRNLVGFISRLLLLAQG
jgi:hypothetical protein